MKNFLVSLPIARYFLNFILLFDLIGIGILLFISIRVVESPSVEYYFVVLTGTSGKLELLEFIGWVISGLFAVLGVIGLLQGADALDKQNKVTEKGHIQDRFKAATEHLGNKSSVSARIAAFYEFYRLATIESEPNSQKYIFDILCAHLRQITKNKNYQSNDKNLVTPGSTEIKPTEEVQSLLKVLFTPYNKDKFIFVDMVADLEGANLQGANLQEVSLLHANLREVNLQGANLQGANLQGANLREANLQDAKLQEAKLQEAKLQDAKLQRAYLQGTDLREAKLQEAKLQEAKLQGADLQGADLQRAYLQDANLQDANLQGTDLQDANLQEAKLQGANLQRAYLQGTDLQYVNLQGADLQEANLQEANLLRAYLQDANLQGADLQEADLQDANLQGTDLQKANLQSADLQGANLQGATINKNNKTMPDGWENVVEKDDNGETGVIFV